MYCNTGNLINTLEGPGNSIASSRSQPSSLHNHQDLVHFDQFSDAVFSLALFFYKARFVHSVWGSSEVRRVVTLPFNVTLSLARREGGFFVRRHERR